MDQGIVIAVWQPLAPRRDISLVKIAQEYRSQALQIVYLSIRRSQIAACTE